ncbi:hypothetical protein N0V82_002705 [Gnomoniopsis sp. IMI 355080]|nr:hypothetical protein N0V82_002705 [Gnomoniopsis sp. IMI 355080]
MANSQRRFMFDDMNLLENSKYSDVRIVCGERTWKEARTHTVTVTEFEKTPELVNVMIRYIYSGALDIKTVIEDEIGAVMTTLVSPWAIADFFLFEALQKDVIEVFENFCESYFEMLISTSCAGVGERYSKKLEQVCKEISSGVNAAYEEFPHAKPCQKVLVDLIHAA